MKFKCHLSFQFKRSHQVTFPRVIFIVKITFKCSGRARPEELPFWESISSLQSHVVPIERPDSSKNAQKCPELETGNTLADVTTQNNNRPPKKTLAWFEVFSTSFDSKKLAMVSETDLHISYSQM